MIEFYLLTGLAALLLAASASRLPRWGKIVALALLIIVFGLLGMILLSRPITRNVEPEEAGWYTETPWKHLLLFGAMLLGMVSNTLFDYLNARVRARKAGKRSMPKLLWEEMLMPIVIAGLVFGYFWGKHGEEEMSLASFLVSYQNGFFWQSVLEKVRSRNRR